MCVTIINISFTPVHTATLGIAVIVCGVLQTLYFKKFRTDYARQIPKTLHAGRARPIPVIKFAQVSQVYYSLWLVLYKARMDIVLPACCTFQVSEPEYKQICVQYVSDFLLWSWGSITDPEITEGHRLRSCYDPDELFCSKLTCSRNFSTVSSSK